MGDSKEEGEMDSGGNRKKPGPQPWSLTKLRACSELELRAAEVSDMGGASRDSTGLGALEEGLISS